MPIDDESKKLWESFRATEKDMEPTTAVPNIIKPCCLRMKAAMKSQDGQRLQKLTINGQDPYGGYSFIVHYCPECGAKIV